VTAPALDTRTMKWILTVAAAVALIYWLRTRRKRK
jgi:hypothetical protein